MGNDTRELTLHVSDSIGDVEALLQQPRDARWLLVLAHGAGAGMRHAFMEALAAELAAVEIATLRYQFPYMQHGSGRPNPPAILTATVRAAVAAAAESVPRLPLLAGGKSLGARMTSQLFADAPSSAKANVETLARVRGLIFFGFPLHPPGQLSTKRAEHLNGVALPMLFLQGTRDAFADVSLLRPVCEKLDSRAMLHLVDTADHSFHVLKKSGKTDSEVIRELARTTAAWAAALPA